MTALVLFGNTQQGIVAGTGSGEIGRVNGKIKCGESDEWHSRRRRGGWAPSAGWGQRVWASWGRIRGIPETGSRDSWEGALEGAGVECGGGATGAEGGLQKGLLGARVGSSEGNVSAWRGVTGYSRRSWDGQRGGNW